MQTKRAFVITVIAVVAVMAASTMIAKPVYAPGPCTSCQPASTFAPGHQIQPAQTESPGSIQSVQNTGALGQLKDCTSCAGGFWGSVPGQAAKQPSSPGP